MIIGEPGVDLAVSVFDCRGNKEVVIGRVVQVKKVETYNNIRNQWGEATGIRITLDTGYSITMHVELVDMLSKELEATA